MKIRMPFAFTARFASIKDTGRVSSHERLFRDYTVVEVPEIAFAETVPVLAIRDEARLPERRYLEWNGVLFEGIRTKAGRVDGHSFEAELNSKECLANGSLEPDLHDWLDPRRLDGSTAASDPLRLPTLEWWEGRQTGWYRLEFRDDELRASEAARVLRGKVVAVDGAIFVAAPEPTWRRQILAADRDWEEAAQPFRFHPRPDLVDAASLYRLDRTPAQDIPLRPPPAIEISPGDLRCLRYEGPHELAHAIIRLWPKLRPILFRFRYDRDAAGALAAIVDPIVSGQAALVSIVDLLDAVVGMRRSLETSRYRMFVHGKKAPDRLAAIAERWTRDHSEYVERPMELDPQDQEALLDLPL